MSEYAEFIRRKQRVFGGLGHDGRATLPPALYDWQTAIVRWALRKGRAAIFADCGLGKTLMQVAWADALNVPALILAPLCVAEQTVEQAARIGIPVHYARDQRDVSGRLSITNYERLDKFDPRAFQAVVLDESSILKSMDGKTRTALITAFADTPFRLCCTATPSPNDISEMANHAEFLGLVTRPEFLATWFVHDDAGWRMKRHAVQPFYRWLASWAVAMRRPSDLGYDDDRFALPPLCISDVMLDAERPPEGVLFHGMALNGIHGRLSARRAALSSRVEAVARIVREGGQWICWCGLNEESDALAKAIPDAVNVQGSDSYAEKVGAVHGFISGAVRVLISKPKILGFGMNFQHCHQMAFVGLSDSYETYYQCIRRCWRFGQAHPVDVRIVLSESEVAVVENVRRKEAHAEELSGQLVRHMTDFEREELTA